MSLEEPEVDFPAGEPPADLQISDIWEGDGAFGWPTATAARDVP